VYPVLSKPLHQIVPDDLSALLAPPGYPEGEQIEFKEFIGTDDGPDIWHIDQSGISDAARDEILAELVALANTTGGHLLIGIGESKAKPPRADRITPVPKCKVAVERILNVANDCVDPPIPHLSGVGICTDGESGILVFRVRKSIYAPHRLKGASKKFRNECFVRRAASTRRLTMHEIQNLTLNLNRGLQSVERHLNGFEGAFVKNLAARTTTETPNIVGVRCSIVPVIAAFELTREEVAGVAAESPYDFNVPSTTPDLLTGKLGPVIVNAFSLPCRSCELRTILRGVHRLSRDQAKVFSHKLYMDGSQTLEYLHFPPKSMSTNNTLEVGWILSFVATLLACAERLSALAANPMAEFAVQVQIRGHHAPPKLVHYPYGSPVIQQIEAPEILYPTYPYSPEHGITALLNAVCTDLLASAGQEPKTRFLS
jgi:hypothetical protein